MTKTPSKSEKNNMKKVMLALRDNARAGPTTLAEKTGLTRQTVSLFMRRFQREKYVWGYVPVIEPKKLDLKMFMVLIKTSMHLAPGEVIEKINEYAKSVFSDDLSEGSILFCGYLHGDYDVLLLLYAKDLIHARKAISGLMGFHKDMVRDFILEDVLLPVNIMGKKNPYLDDELKKF